MKRLVLLTAAALAIAGGIDAAAAAELPAYESAGFPITTLQLSVIGPAHVQEASAIPTPTLGGLPASPNQIGVLTPHKRSLGSRPQT